MAVKKITQFECDVCDNATTKDLDGWLELEAKPPTLREYTSTSITMVTKCRKTWLICADCVTKVLKKLPGAVAFADNGTAADPSTFTLNVPGDNILLASASGARRLT